MNEPATVTGLLIFARALYLGGGMVLVNAAVFRWLVLAPASGNEAGAWNQHLECRLRTVFLTAAIVLAASTALWFWAVAAGMSGTSLHGALDRDVWSTVFLQTRFGTVCQIRIGLFMLLMGLSRNFCRIRKPPERRTSALNAAMTFTTSALLASVAWTDHAGAASGPAFPWTLIADSLHLLAGTVWPAGLLFFAWILSSALARENTAPLDVTTAIARRFSTVSLAAVMVLAVTGLIDSFFLVRSLGALVNTPYGRVLCLKLAVFVAMLALAAWNRFRLLPLLAETNGPTVFPPVTIIHRLRRFVRIELTLAAAIVVIVAFLGTLPPPHG